MSRDRRSVVSHCENRVAERGNPDSRFLDRLDCAVTGRNSPLMPEFDPSGGIKGGGEFPNVAARVKTNRGLECHPSWSYSFYASM